MTYFHINKAWSRTESRSIHSATGLYLLTNILKDVDNEEGRDEVVDALYITAGWMPDGPDEQNPLKDLKKKEK